MSVIAVKAASNGYGVAPTANKQVNTIVQVNALDIRGNVYIPGHLENKRPKNPTQGRANIVIRTYNSLHDVLAFHDALAFGAIHMRSAQLSVLQIPPQSLDWIWSMPFKDWLRNELPLFWITGKPSTGESTLVQHLRTAHRLQQYLDSVVPNMSS